MNNATLRVTYIFCNRTFEKKGTETELRIYLHRVLKKNIKLLERLSYHSKMTWFIRFFIKI